ncbi:DNA polymerase (family 10)/histidinol-phosphatase (PHP family) [Natranaerovirga hydrolytica]|uniref:DNA polymerase (Family 10)/histidinol-phosphatase (PHP family) n=1 Tax=Natranaerovirga hydrolytica TaxID=680378 RepID=A0A4R1N512_9FIRM|nr:CpsB/CapC family capsule biosynthesis tyrosine phosphatase [Natranaerovirga hydrolytica]TCK98059.1 DNA polymerase (family 10)/histidinol-phosphatase (PHP family) [Natranaerovirga hydrolytica]
MFTKYNIIDLHNHTFWSDGINSSKEIVENAIEHNINAIGITDHFNTVKCPSIQPNELDGYLREMKYIKEMYSSKIKVFIGIEINCIPFPESLNNLPYDKLNALDFVLIENLDHLSPAICLEDILKDIKKLKIPVGLAHTDIFKLANKNIEKGGLNYILDLLKTNNIFWEINSNSSYDSFNSIIYNNDDSDVLNLFKKIQEHQINITVGSDTHSIDDYEKNRLKQGNVARRLLTQ